MEFISREKRNEAPRVSEDGRICTHKHLLEIQSSYRKTTSSDHAAP